MTEVLMRDILLDYMDAIFLILCSLLLISRQSFRFLCNASLDGRNLRRLSALNVALPIPSFGV